MCGIINRRHYESRILIFIFSIILPLSKLLASTFYLKSSIVTRTPLLNFLVFKSGKWSIADVLVVAIFMSFIGFRGVISNQLEQIESMSSKIEILTTDNSSLGVGFSLFLAYCVAGLVLSAYLQRKNSTAY